MGSDADTHANQREAPPTRLQLIVMAESGSQRIELPRDGTVTIGRAETAEVRIEDPSLSRNHAALHVRNTLQLEDLGSSNGTFLHGVRLEPHRRVDVAAGEFFEVGSVVCVVRGVDSHERLRQVRAHEHFEARLQDDVARARDGRSHPAVIRIRLDDDDPEAIAAMLAAVRAGDLLARYAPGEYEVLLDAADLAAAPELAAQLARALAGRNATFGLAVYPRDGYSAEELFAAACRALEPEPMETTGDIVIESPTMRRLHELLGRVAAGGVNVLLLGETGVGKEVFAARLHAQSPRAAGPFLKLNCAAFTAALLESELFGHERGAFTGADRRKLGLLEAASGGMVFLDEVGELEASAQAKLLRVIEDREIRRVGGIESIPIDVVFVAATNRDLATEVAERRFRADLFYRLDGFTLTIPPLRERREEIVPLARMFVAAVAKRAGLPAAPPLADDAIELLETYRWSGNIRELRNMIERAVLLSGGGPIRPEHLSLDSLRAIDGLEASLARASSAAEPPPGLSAGERAERDHIIATLASVYGNQTRAAEVLGISRRWLTTKMARFRIPRPRKR